MNTFGVVKRVCLDINNPIMLYALYDNELNEDSLIKSIKNVFKSHDVFRIDINISSTLKDYLPKIGRIDSFDEISFKKSINDVINSKSNFIDEIIDLRLIYLHNSLRGYFIKCNPVIIDNASMNILIADIESNYFNKKVIKKSSYFKWLSDNKIRLKKETTTQNHQVKEYTISLTENQTKKLRESIVENSIDVTKFLISIIGTYFSKTEKREKLVFRSNCFKKGYSEIIGDTSTNSMFSLRIPHREHLYQILKNEIRTCEEEPFVTINKYPEINKKKGRVKVLTPFESKSELEFLIKDSLWTCDLIVRYNPNCHTEKEIEILINRIKKIIDIYLDDKEMKVNDITFLSEAEENIAFTFATPENSPIHKKIYDSFVEIKNHHNKEVALIEKGKKYTYNDILDSVIKLSKKLERINTRPGELIAVKSHKDIHTLIAILAISSRNGVYALESECVKYTINCTIIGFKVEKNGEVESLTNTQYTFKDYSVSKRGFEDYCKWSKDYFDYKIGDRVLLSNKATSVEFLVEGIPVILSGGTIVSNDLNESFVEQIEKLDINIVTLNKKQLKELRKTYSGDMLKHVIIKNDFTSYEDSDYKIHQGITLDVCSPYIFMKELKSGNFAIGDPLPGVGVLVLNNQKSLSFLCEYGDLHVFGPAISSLRNRLDRIKISGSEFKDVVKTSIRVKWSMTGELLLEKL